MPGKYNWDSTALTGHLRKAVMTRFLGKDSLERKRAARKDSGQPGRIAGSKEG
jgi:hypothetical protein